MKTTLIFVYNAKTGFLNKKLDKMHKIISPSTYNCGLCSLTHSNFGEKKSWKDFKNRKANWNFVFLYKNEFLKEYAIKLESEMEFPAVFRESKNSLEVVLQSSQINNLSSLLELQKKIEEVTLG